MSNQKLFKVLADPTRRKILLLLRNGKLTVGELAKECDLKDSALSYHLKLLKETDLISEERYKNFIYYEINTTILDEIILWINTLKGGDLNER